MFAAIASFFGFGGKVAEVVKQELSAEEDAKEFVNQLAVSGLAADKQRDAIDREIIAHLLKLLEEPEFRKYEDRVEGEGKTYIRKLRQWLGRRALVG